MKESDTRKRDIIIRVIVYGLILVFAAITIRSFSLRNYSAKQACIDNLKIIDGGKNGEMVIKPTQNQQAYDGTYVTPLEVSGYFGEHLVLSNRGYQYSMYSDVKGRAQPRYPISGSFTVESNTILLLHDSPSKTIDRRTPIIVNNRFVLLRDDALELWQVNGQLYPYGCLVNVSNGVNIVNGRWEGASLTALVTNKDMIAPYQ